VEFLGKGTKKGKFTCKKKVWKKERNWVIRTT
jgi:hypothetical protein